MHDLTPLEREAIALLEELIDIEGPQPGTGGWAAKVRDYLAKHKGKSK